MKHLNEHYFAVIIMNWKLFSTAVRNYFGNEFSMPLYTLRNQDPIKRQKSFSNPSCNIRHIAKSKNTNIAKHFVTPGTDILLGN